jgi:perosamine synthetase
MKQQRKPMRAATRKRAKPVSKAGMPAPTLPWARPDFWGRERRYVMDALDSTWISGGPYVDRLERELRGFHGSRHCLSASNGTTALHMAYLALGIGRGDEVVVPGFGFQAAANVAIHVGARPVFAEVDPATWCMTAETLERVLSKRTRLVVPVHTYGNLCAMDGIVDLARRRRFAVVEDAAESFGSRWRGRLCGTFGAIGTLSFQATKTISTGEGGAVLTDDQELHDRMWLYRNHGMKQRRYWHEVAGHNFRLTNLQAALGCAQFERLPRIAVARRRMDRLYRRHLSACTGVVQQLFPPEVDAVVWAIAVRLDPQAYPQGRDAVMKQMLAAGIETRPGFFCPSAMTHLYRTPRLPVCEGLSQQIISLPSIPTMAAGDIARVCATLAGLRR